MSELKEPTEQEGSIWQERMAAKAAKPALVPLEDRPLLAHLMQYSSDKVHQKILTKAEIYLHPNTVQTFHARYHDLRIPENLPGTTSHARRSHLFDDTRTLSVAAVAYAISNSQNPGTEPFAYVFDAAKLETRGYALHSNIEGNAALAEGHPNEVIGTINLPTQWGAGKADDKLTAEDRKMNAKKSDAFFVHTSDMFLVGEKLVPAESWLRLSAQDRAEHMAPKQAIV